MLCAVLLGAMATGAEDLRCAECGKAITGRYLNVGEETHCSKACYQRTLPRCDTCGRIVQGNHLVQGDKVFCSRKCFEASLPTCTICGKPLRESYRIDGKLYCKEHAKGPRCAACTMPLENGQTLEDGRRVCGSCFPGLVFDSDEADDLYMKAAAVVRRIVGRDLPLVPPMQLVGRDNLPSHDDLADGISVEENGRYVRHTETTKVTLFGKVLREEQQVDKKILILYGLTREQFLSTAAHELMHDIVSEQYPRFDEEAPDWAEEGVCQYAAAMLCRKLGLDEKLREIETSFHPVYGGGYRYMIERFGESNWAGLSAWMNGGAFRSLPRTAPDPEPSSD